MLNVPEFDSLDVLPPASLDTVATDGSLPSVDDVRCHHLEGSFSRHYKITDKVLGSGLNGEVKLAVHRETGKKVAVKSYNVQLMNQKQRTDLAREVYAQSSLDHPNVARLEAVYESREHVRLLVESLSGGEVFSHLMEEECFDEHHATLVMTQLLQAVAHMHEVGLVHRDIKPENMLYATADRDTVKLIDFGFCTRWEEGDKPMTRRCGTDGYMAPEVVRKQVGYTNAADLWSVGVVAHVLLTGDMIGRSSDWTPVFSSRMAKCSIEAQKFVAALLQVDPDVRMTAKQALQHTWLRSVLKGRRERTNTDCSTVAESVDLDNSSQDLSGCDVMSSSTTVSKWKEDFAGIFPTEEPAVPKQEKKSLWSALPSIMPSMKLGASKKVGTMLAAVRNCKSKRASRVSIEI
jgi:serine/threonine protein kinase